ncbi:MAG TPA: alpha/beta fold hydrolase [Polyangiaceae bacterium]|nr:alpha/beta fold hydrolase [Polyangiaceae bacterium]
MMRPLIPQGRISGYARALMMGSLRLDLGAGVAFFIAGCTCTDSREKTGVASNASSLAQASASGSVSATPTAQRPPRPTQAAPKPETITALSSDRFKLHVSRWKAKEPSTVSVLLVHRLGGDRSEWTPLIERLLPSDEPMDIVSFDLRGHGESTVDPAKPNRPVHWSSFDLATFEKMDGDVEAVMGLHEKGNKFKWILVGSDLGANLVVRQAHRRSDNIVAVALVSPGASLRGLELYRPFASVLELPNLLLAGTKDTVSDEPVRLLGQMSKTSTRVTWDVSGHGAEALGKERWQMWDELANWIDERVRGTRTMVETEGSASPPASASSGGVGSVGSVEVSKPAP